MITAVLFDLDETLLDRETSLRAFLRAQHQRHAALADVPLTVYTERFLALDDNGTFWKDIVYRELLLEFNIDTLSWETLLEEYVTRFHEHCVGYEGMQQVLKQLLAQNLRLGIITNGRYPFQLHTIESLGIHSYFSSILVSGIEGFSKPAPEIFQLALRQLDVAAETAVFIGDHPNKDIGGAKNVGMKAIWMYKQRWASCPEADATCYQFSELPSLITSLT